MHRTDLPPKLVQSFLTVLRMQNYTKAAQALNLTQPAVSQHISRLEEIFGFSLIERNRGLVLPTNEAQALLPDLERFERSVELMFEKARAVAQGGRHTVQIATPTSMVAYLLAPVVAEMRATGKRILPVFREVDDYTVYDMVRADEVDFALTSMTGSDSALSCSYLFRDRPCLVFPEGHPVSGDGPIDLDDFIHFDLIRPPLETASNRTIEIFERTSGAKFNFVAESSRLMTFEVMVRAGLGILIVPALSARLIAHSGLRFRPINMEVGWRNCQLIRPKHARPSSLAKQVIDGVMQKIRLVKDEMPDLIESKEQER